MPDKYGYPTDEELEYIKNFDVLREPIQELLDHIKSIWWMDGKGIELKGKHVLRLELHTLGWYGNELIIDALFDNTMFHTLYWEKSERGGHYYFRINLRKSKMKEQDAKENNPCL